MYRRPLFVVALFALITTFGAWLHAGGPAEPADLVDKLTRSELRDLVEFLAGLKEAPKVGSESK